MQVGFEVKQKVLDELNELLNIPQFERIVFHKIGELKLYFRDEIKFYKNLKEHFRQSAYGNMQVLDAQKEISKKIQPYHFELSQNNDYQWIATSIEPTPPPGYDIYDIVPEEIAEYVGYFKTSLGKIETKKELSFPEIKGKAFDLCFAKYSEWYALGTIRSYEVPSQDSTAEVKPDHMTEIYNYDKKETEERNLKEFIYYMQKYPALRHYFFTELNMKMKPLIVGDLVEITASLQPVDLL